MPPLGLAWTTITNNLFVEFVWNRINWILVSILKITPEKKNEIEELIDDMISGGDDLVDHLKEVLPDSLSETLVMFQESNVVNLKKIKEFVKTK